MQQFNTSVIILVRPQLGVNIGMVARAMLNCGVTNLRLVAPRDGWPSDDAISASAGAAQVIENAEVFDTTEEACADLHQVFATTARTRSLAKPIFTQDTAAQDGMQRLQQRQQVGILFGPENAGLSNDDLTLANGLIHIPINPGFASLNLAQAVLLTCYPWLEYCLQQSAMKPLAADVRPQPPANQETLQGLFHHLEGLLSLAGFFHVADKRDIMMRNIRTMLLRANFTNQEVQTLHGILRYLSQSPAPTLEAVNSADLPLETIDKLRKFLNKATLAAAED